MKMKIKGEKGPVLTEKNNMTKGVNMVNTERHTEIHEKYQKF